ncbi:UvrD-helicase domain-containing protein [Paenibacillus spongiae]|uniref:ATP-dependent helicase/nuclease subunit A n=1 Tax=Paenibacillus spongiae TaxID=2909671 RepID=A0ABY5SHC9_9BACL|nr:UvrD-helicase domain-containing protein [Paenibacillus spongiae]UVI32127.1 UvrD-helicase domain-containing protein [Paenibacillus spongiae]
MRTADYPKKPEGSTWTDDQWKAIVADGSNILVAAAAGSGKTAVLVERIIRKITADTDVDRLLVATFTKAAAAEMKERIRIALEKELDKRPESEHLRRQLALMGRASITTLHSFCLDVIRKYYSLIGLDPGFRIANQTEADLLRMDVLDALFEERYAEAEQHDTGFTELVERFGGERGDGPLYALVMRLYQFSQSHPWPAVWLKETAAAFDVEDASGLGETQWVESLAGTVELALEGAERLLLQALDVTRLPGGPDAYAATFNDDLAVIRMLRSRVDSTPWEAWHEAFRAAGFGKLKSQKGDGVDKALQEQAKELRDMAKAVVADLQDEFFVRSPGEFAAELRDLAPLMHTLAGLAEEFGIRFESAKREKGLLDFGDMEHYCLRILRDPSSTPGSAVPSAAALEYQAQFDEILLDEYQDTNMVQEAIVTLIARSGEGNRFMVGDVKQSIYRFRLAEPNLFLRKYKAYGTDDGRRFFETLHREEAEDASTEISTKTALMTPLESAEPASSEEFGLRIDLARNFRSRQEVVDGTNGVFRAIMRETVAEMDYDERAELVCGASYPPAGDGGSPDRYAIEFALLDRGTGGDEPSSEQEAAADSSDEEQPATMEDLQTVQLEARWIANRILQLKGLETPLHAHIDAPFEPYDGKRGSKRALAWRDIVILLRADKQWAPVIIEELQAKGIPAYAELSSGYFEATEVETMLSLLRVIDNPYQDIPLAGALRSPVVGLTGEELALIRIAAGRLSYYDAVRKAEGDPSLPQGTRSKLSDFLSRLESWREEARQGALSELLWRIFRETGYYDLVGGMPGGLQRQANLRALHDRARQYEATSLRGLFRFLRFIDRMRESGGDLGTARALGEQEDVVRIMSIHKSKGLEFPVVFVAGLGKLFNRQDLNSPFLMHKELGFGPRFVDTELRVSYPTLPYLAIRERLRMESLAEEMRILYVALTRPKEKMFLVGTAADAAKLLQRWQASLDADGQLPDFRLAQAKRFLDWVGPLAMRDGIPLAVYEMEDEREGVETERFAARHEDRLVERLTLEGERSNDAIFEETGLEANKVVPFPSANPFLQWKKGVVPASLLGMEAAAAVQTDEAAEAEFADRLQAVHELIPVFESPEEALEIERRLAWEYPYRTATQIPAKTSVTEMKRLHAQTDLDDQSEVLLIPSSAGGTQASDTDRAGHGWNGEDAGSTGWDGANDQVEQVELVFGEAFETAAVPEAETVFETEPFVKASGGGEYTFRLRRPKFMEEAALTAAERGTVSHLVMQHIPLESQVDEQTVHDTVQRLLERRMLTELQAGAVNSEAVAAFFREEVGQRLLHASWVRRETPFSCTFPAERVYPQATESYGGEPILIQGVIDCLFRDEHGLVLLDYKTDRITMKQWDKAAERHRFQLTLYAEAVMRILGEPVDACYVYFFDGGRAVQLF